MTNGATADRERERHDGHLERIAALEAIVARLGEELRIADDRWSRLAGGVGHDLHNLFVGLNGYVSLAREAEVGASHRRGHRSTGRSG